MIKLRVVGYSDDLENLIFAKTGTRRGSHVIPIDDKLFDVLEEVWRERKAAERGAKKAEPAPEVESKLAPREVQRLLRAGQLPGDVAAMAGVDVGWVEKWLSPVLHERAGVIADCQTLWLDKPKLGSSGLPLGEAVVANLRSRHVRMDDEQFAAAWDATRQDAQPWLISLEFSFRGRRQRAVWRYDPHERWVTPVNRLAADLGWVKNGKKAAARAATLERAPARSNAKRKTASRSARKRPARRPAAKKRAAARRPAAKKRAAARRPAAKKRAAARRPAAKKRTASRRPVAKKRAPARRPAPKKRAAARRPVAKKRAPARRAQARRPAKRPARRTTRRR